jgi:NAD(P)-dependent dehydrogenase (short-subunit alcohol dehydrogenase family)
MEPVQSTGLTDKAALVTGAASGIGGAIAMRLASEGAKVALADINEGGITQIVEIIRT